MTITLRTGNSHLKPEEIVDGEEAAKKPHSDTAKHHASKNYRILVVDDDPEILEYIKGELGEWYKSSTAYPTARKHCRLYLPRITILSFPTS